MAEEEDLEYFPGNDMLPDGMAGQIDIFTIIAETSEVCVQRDRYMLMAVPPDLLSSLVKIYVSFQPAVFGVY
jgi:hypothetical protein